MVEMDVPSVPIHLPHRRPPRASHRPATDQLLPRRDSHAQSTRRSNMRAVHVKLHREGGGLSHGPLFVGRVRLLQLPRYGPVLSGVVQHLLRSPVERFWYFGCVHSP